MKKAFTIRRRLRIAGWKIYKSVIVKGGHFDIIKGYTTTAQQFLLFCELPLFIKAALNTENKFLFRLTSLEDAYY